jgi:hypothetical protein
MSDNKTEDRDDTVATPESEARVAKLFADMERSRLARIELGLD